MPYTSAVIPNVELMAPAASSRPGRGSVSGRRRGAASIMAMPIGALMKKPTRQDSQPAKMPSTTSPTVAATPATAA
ncbi:MAG: hypothetical protein QOJ21_3899 [Solirubrobacteraceae bacterium]|nr:hypothetical protein [Solirubrobacteraceae bacterium]